MSRTPSTQRKRAVVALLAVMACTIAAAVLGVILQVREWVFMVCLFTGLWVVLAAIGLWVIEQGRFGRSVRVALAVCAVGLLLSMAEHWFMPLGASGPDAVAKAVFPLAIAASVWTVLCAAALSFSFRTWWWHAVPYGAVAGLSLFVLLVMTMVILEATDRSPRSIGLSAPIIETAMSVLSLLSLACLLALPLMRIVDRLQARSGDSALKGERLRVALACPRCGEGMEALANLSCRCPTCKLALRLEVEEPRCACGYLLHTLRAPVCPECGALVPIESNWLPQPVTGPTGQPSA